MDVSEILMIISQKMFPVVGKVVPSPASVKPCVKTCCKDTECIIVHCETMW